MRSFTLIFVLLLSSLVSACDAQEEPSDLNAQEESFDLRSRISRVDQVDDGYKHVALYSYDAMLRLRNYDAFLTLALGPGGEQIDDSVIVLRVGPNEGVYQSIVVFFDADTSSTDYRAYDYQRGVFTETDYPAVDFDLEEFMRLRSSTEPWPRDAMVIVVFVSVSGETDTFVLADPPPKPVSRLIALIEGD